MFIIGTYFMNKKATLGYFCTSDAKVANQLNT